MKYIVLWVILNNEYVKGSNKDVDLILMCYCYKVRFEHVVLKAVDKRKEYKYGLR